MRISVPSATLDAKDDKKDVNHDKEKEGSMCCISSQCESNNIYATWSAVHSSILSLIQMRNRPRVSGSSFF